MINRLGGITKADTKLFGGKALVLDNLIKKGRLVPPGIVLSTELYSAFIAETGLADFLILNIERQKIEELRWEEVWDLAQRIRLKFINTVMPEGLRQNIIDNLKDFNGLPVVVRSSSPSEDSSTTSFAGLHDSIVDVKGNDEIIDAVKEVWSSLWSDRALIYSREMKLKPEESRMAVVIQSLIRGSKSGVLFTKAPGDSSRMLIESVLGLNEKLVSGEAEPDRFSLDRADGQLLETHYAGDRQSSGLELPYYDLYNTGLFLEKSFKCPQDIEWTIREEKLYILQSRPITTEAGDDKPLWERADKREWYKSLHKNITELKQIKIRIETEFMNELDVISSRLAAVNLHQMDDVELQNEITKRRDLIAEWEKEYWEICIPFAHGVRMFGEIYNRLMKPESPFEFVDLLIHQNLKSIERNQRLEKLSLILKSCGYNEKADEFSEELNSFLADYGQSSFFNGLLFSDTAGFIDFLKAFKADLSETVSTSDSLMLEKAFLSKMDESGREDGNLLLDMGRISYKLRDDDNIQLGKLRGELYRAEDENLRRNPGDSEPLSNEKTAPWNEVNGFLVSERQVTGACASPGYASGRARVLASREDLFKTRKGEIIVCDSIDPNITFVIPLAAGIVERRGGMLVHGAIIAREYHIPCITGVTDVVDIIKNGDYITVDAYNGIVVIEKEPESSFINLNLVDSQKLI